MQRKWGLLPTPYESCTGICPPLIDAILNIFGSFLVKLNFHIYQVVEQDTLDSLLLILKDKLLKLDLFCKIVMV